MLRELRRALSEAISESSEVNRTLRKIREEGYSLYLLVDCKRDANEPEPVAFSTVPRLSSGERTLSKWRFEWRIAKARPAGELPAFIISGAWPP